MAVLLPDRQSELLPVPYFHVVFTVPAPIAEIALHNKAVVYGILFTAAAETLRIIAADPRHLGAEIGLVADTFNLLSESGMAETQRLCEAAGLPQGLRVTSHVADVSDAAQVERFRDEVADP